MVVLVEAPLRRGRDLRAVHGLRRLRDRVPARRARLRRHERRLQAASRSRDYGGPRDCSHGDKACTSCTRACPRFRAWEPEIDEFLFGRPREPEEMSGVFKDICLARAADAELHEVGQDGGLVSAMLVYALEHDIIDAALVSYLEGDGSSWKAIPGIARDARRRDRVGRQPLHVLGQHARVQRPREGRRAHRARRHVVPVVDPAGDEAAQGGQGRAPARAVDRAAVLEDVRRRDLRGAVRGEVRPEEGTTSRR